MATWRTNHRHKPQSEQVAANPSSGKSFAVASASCDDTFLLCSHKPYQGKTRTTTSTTASNNKNFQQQQKHKGMPSVVEDSFAIVDERRASCVSSESKGVSGAGSVTSASVGTSCESSGISSGESGSDTDGSSSSITLSVFNSSSEESSSDDNLISFILSRQQSSMMHRSSSESNLVNQEFNAMQVTVLLNQMRTSNARNKRSTDDDDDDDDESNYSTPSLAIQQALRPKHIQGEAMTMPTTTSTPNQTTLSNTVGQSKPAIVIPKPARTARRASFGLVNTSTRTLGNLAGPLSSTVSKNTDEKSPAKTIVSTSSAMTNPNDEVSPMGMLRTILTERNIKLRTLPVDDDSLDEFFVEISDDRLASYCASVINAVRGDDVDALRSLLPTKRMDGCNRFGESVLHTACRRGSLDVLLFLVREARVDLRVRDDYGRTPLHDACWSAEPKLDMIETLLSEWPDLLFVQDKRGFTPLQYIRSAQWHVWKEFMSNHKDLFVPKVLLQD